MDLLGAGLFYMSAPLLPPPLSISMSGCVLSFGVFQALQVPLGFSVKVQSCPYFKLYVPFDLFLLY